MPEKYHFDELTWPEVNGAVAAGKVPVIPVGSVEQHAHHLPLRVDWLCATSVVEDAARRRPDRLLMMPPVHYGYCCHVMDFPGTINIGWDHLVHFVLDITKSLAYHGFKKIVIVNGHGSNAPLMDLVGRRTNLETDAVCAVTNWWDLLTVDPNFNARWRESQFPGGVGHACELETSMLLHLAPELVRKEKAVNEQVKFHQPPSRFHYVDLFGHGPVGIVEWTSSYTETGTCGAAALGTAEKGKIAFEEAVRQLIAFAEEFHRRPFYPRRDHHSRPPTIPVPG